MRITNSHNLPEPLVAAVSRQRTPTPNSIFKLNHYQYLSELLRKESFAS
jgi:hypothetical protein